MFVLRLVLLLNSLAGVFGNLIGGFLFDKFGGYKAILIGVVLNLVAITLLTIWHDWPQYVIFLTMLGFSGGMVYPAIYAIAGSAWPQGGRKAFNAIFLTNNVGVAIGPALAGIVADIRFDFVFVGAGHNLAYLYQCLMSDLANGYRVLGYFEDVDSKHLPKEVVRIGQINEVIDWLENNQVDKLFCNLPDSRSVEIIAIINYCESHLIHFYSVPNVRNYVHRAMEVEMMDNMPVLKLRREPLNSPYNQIVKRFLDILISSVFIITCFWWIYIIVAIITKITMPGPVLFKQKRNGLLGEEFTCLKFRSMKVNRDADRLQATKDDPRKTKWGNIMRSTSIDELPQFLNVLMGDMSVVGPRPHMVKHTEEYSELIEKYMVRHWVKPGITGWAQVNGARGETQELWQMEDRIKKDIWYVENWSIWLDIRIMIKTLKNAICGDKQAY